MRIAPQIRPVRLRRVGAISPLPDDRLAPGGGERPYPSRQGIAGIGRDELLVARQRVAFECRRIGILRTEIADRLVSDRGDLIGRSLRRRIGRAIEKHEIGIELLRMPRHLRALARLVDAQRRPIEQFGQRQAAGADHFGERLRVCAVGPRLAWRDRARRGVEGDQHSGFGFDQSKAACDLLAALDEGLRAGGIQHHDAGLHRQGPEPAEIISEAHALGRNVGLALNREIDRNEIILAGKLHPVARQIDHGDRVRPRRLGLLHEVAKALAQRIAIEVARTDHVKTRRLQGLRDQAGVVGRGRQRRFGIGAVADHQRDALFLLLGGGGTQQPRHPRNEDQAQQESGKACDRAHGSSTQGSGSPPRIRRAAC